MWDQIMIVTKVCAKCGEDKPESDFHRRRDRHGNMCRRAVCRICWHKSRGTSGNKVKTS